MSCVPVREVDDRLLEQDLARSAEQEMAVRELVADCSGEGAIARLPVKKTVPVFSFLTGTPMRACTSQGKAPGEV
jgi:hypothetical protein